MLALGPHEREKQAMLQGEVLAARPSSTKQSQASWWLRAIGWLATNGMNATIPRATQVALIKRDRLTRGVAVANWRSALAAELIAACQCRTNAEVTSGLFGVGAGYTKIKDSIMIPCTVVAARARSQ